MSNFCIIFKLSFYKTLDQALNLQLHIESFLLIFGISGVVVLEKVIFKDSSRVQFSLHYLFFAKAFFLFNNLLLPFFYGCFVPFLNEIGQ